jgi:hypothetical protein
LTGNFESFLLWELAFLGQTFCQGIALKKLHGKKVDLAVNGLGGVNFVDQTDVWVTYFKRIFKLGR